ncbi:hypothetical protein LIER_31714 [Lithospermum erythrorhizon]|uniref:Uncharacterized protein n=1 Tax=Lithospermum erythrorhizon TaxID=34254 RepID=A0AAV3RX35_LITER
MNSSGNNDHPQQNDALNLNNTAPGQNDDAPPNVQEPINIAPVVLEELRARLPSVRKDHPAISSYVREEMERTYTHTPPDEQKKKKAKGGKIEYMTLLSASVGSIFLEIEDKWMLPRPPKHKNLQYKRDISKYFQYYKDHGHDMDDCRHLKIEIKKLIQKEQLKEYVHKKNQIADESGADMARRHTLSRIHRRRGQPVGSGKPHGDHREASIAGHQDGRGGLQWNHWKAIVVPI